MQEGWARTSSIPLMPYLCFDGDFEVEMRATDYQPDENP
jgi:hypothetical protein